MNSLCATTFPYFSMNLKDFKTGMLLLMMMTILLGVCYPLLITGVAQIFFARKANGSLVSFHGVAVGSELLGQQFNRPDYFWSRPSATKPSPYNGAASSGSNLGPLNPILHDSLRSRMDRMRRSDVTARIPVPVDLVTASASGLDPHISVQAARFQIPRVSRARVMSETQVRELVEKYTEAPQWGCLGEPRVNVLLLNIALDEQCVKRTGR